MHCSVRNCTIVRPNRVIVPFTINLLSETHDVPEERSFMVSLTYVTSYCEGVNHIYMLFDDLWCIHTCDFLNYCVNLN